MATYLKARPIVNDDDDDDEVDADHRGMDAVWGMVWILVAMKFVTIGIVLAMNFSDVAILIGLALNWHFIAFAVVVGAGLGVMYYRYWKVRRRRRQLIASEFDLNASYRGVNPPRKVEQEQLSGC